MRGFFVCCVLVLVHCAWGQIEIGTPPVAGSPGRVSIVATPIIAKDASGPIDIYVTTSQQVRGGPATLTIALDDSGVHCEANFTVQNGSTSNTKWKLDLAGSGVPRFTRPMHFLVSATLTRSGASSGTSTVVMPEIKLPMVVVRGINPTNDVWEDTTFVNAMVSHGYVEQTGPGVYTTLWYMHTDPYGNGLDYDPTYDLLSRNAQVLDNYISYVVNTANPVTYADKVDIVAHSKGGLVSRQYLYSYQVGASRVRRLVMCASPHTGSAEAWIDNFIGAAAIKQLYPTYNWYRSSSTGAWSQNTPNAALIDLNTNSRMPQSVDYWLLYGSTGPTSTAQSYTGTWPFGSAGKGDGDDYVLTASALGYDLTLSSNGTATRGARIRAFDPAYGSKVPSGEIYLPGQTHTGFFGNAVETIYGVFAQ